jgi:hypothetical protein
VSEEGYRSRDGLVDQSCLRRPSNKSISTTAGHPGGSEHRHNAHSDGTEQ